MTCICYRLWGPYSDEFLQKKKKKTGKFYPVSDTRLVFCLSVNISLFLIWTRNQPAGISICSQLESITSSLFLHCVLTTAYDAGGIRLFVQMWKVKLREKVQVIHWRTPGQEFGAGVKFQLIWPQRDNLPTCELLVLFISALKYLGLCTTSFQLPLSKLLKSPFVIGWYSLSRVSSTLRRESSSHTTNSMCPLCVHVISIQINFKVF